MADRVTLVRGTATVRVVKEDVERFKALGYSEPAKPAEPARKTAARRRKPKAGDE